MTSFAQKVAMWVGAIVIAIALGGLAFWIAGNIGRPPVDAGNTQPPSTTQQPPPVQPASTQLIDIQVTGTVARTNPAKLEITIREVVLESPSNVTLCRTENILVRLRQNDPSPAENARVRIKGEYNHQECSITLKGTGHSISQITSPTLPIALIATINEMSDARNIIKVKVTAVESGPEPCTRENLTVRLKDPLSPTVSLQDKAEIKGNYHPATCEVRLDTPDTSISFPPVLIELRGTIRSISGNRFLLYNWEVVAGPPTCQQRTRLDLTVIANIGEKAQEIPPTKRVKVKGDYHPDDCMIRVEGARSDHFFTLDKPEKWRMIVEGVVFSFEPRQKMELTNLNILEGEPPCDQNRLTVVLTDRKWRDTVYRVGDKVKVDGQYYEAECRLYPEQISTAAALLPGFLISGGLIFNSAVTLYSVALVISVIDKVSVLGCFGVGWGSMKLKTGVEMLLNVSLLTLSGVYQIYESFYISAGFGGMLVRQALPPAWKTTTFMPVVRIAAGYRLGFFLIEGGFYVSLGPLQ